jgi:hypothetical protein
MVLYIEMCRAQYMLTDINVMQCHCSLWNVTLSKLQVLFNNAILPLSAVSDHWLHTLKSAGLLQLIPSAAAGHSGVHAKEMLKPAQYSALQGLLLWLNVLFLQQEVDSCASSPAAARLLTLLLNGSLG